MNNLQTINYSFVDSCMFDQKDQQQRKIQTPYTDHREFSFENSSLDKPIMEKIQFSQTDLSIVKKSKARKIKTTDDPDSNKKYGHWSPEENKRYHWFLELHQEHFFNKHLRRTDRIFKLMATFVETRQAEQCRSHHQKMQKKHKYFSKILMSLRIQNYSCDNHELILEDIYQKDKQIDTRSILSSSSLRLQYSNSNQKEYQPFSSESNEIKTPKTTQLKPEPDTIRSLQKISHNFFEQEHKQQEYQQQLFQRPKDDIDDILNDNYERNIDLNILF